MPTTWIERNCRSGWPSAVISRRMRSRPNRIPNSSSDSRYRSASSPVITARPAPRGVARACRARPAPPAAAPWPRTLVGELLLGALDLGLELGALLVDAGACALSRSSSPLARICTAPPGIGTVATMSAPLASPNCTRARREMWSVVSSKPGASQRGRDGRPGLDLGQVAPAAQRLNGGDRPLHGVLGLGVDRRGVIVRTGARRAPPAGPRCPGCRSRSPRSRTGSADGRARPSRSARAAARRPARARRRAAAA